MSYEPGRIQRELLAILAKDADFTVRELTMRVFAIKHPSLGQEGTVRRALTSLLRTGKAKETGILRVLPGRQIHTLYAGSQHPRAGRIVRPSGRPDEVVL
jgi:hypothetical protein